ncbi:MAG: lytic murein transglycosylase B [Betaproteobacteria bacterium]|nr:lytic murein transglycosylase B [Betaproteobacteria bacterium]
MLSRVLAFLPAFFVIVAAFYYLPVRSKEPSIAEMPAAQTFAQEMREKHGMDEADLLRRFARLTPNHRVLKLIAPPAPGSTSQRSWQRYRSRFIEHKRIQQGLDFWQQHAATLKRAEAAYGVPAEIIVAIIGVETFYGQNTGSFNAFSTLTTLAFYDPNRSAFFRQELEQLLLLARENNRNPESYTGSYAGALGIPQFLPGSLRRYAVDFDNDGIIDLADSEDDAIGSVASFLAAHGWQKNAPIAIPVRMPDNLPPETLATWLEGGIRPSLPATVLLAAGVAAEPFEGADLNVTLIDLATPDVPTEYWLGFENFYVLTRYNRSSFYAMSVFQLAEQIALARKR